MLPRHELQTPTTALTAVGLSALAWHAARGGRRSELLAFAALGLASMGTAMALGAEVERKGEEWGWRGLWRSLRRPSRKFRCAFFMHLPQLLTAGMLAYGWYRRRNGLMEPPCDPRIDV